MLILFTLVIVSLAEKPITVEQLVSQPVPEHARKLTGQALVDYVNGKQPYFKAKLSTKMNDMYLMDEKYIAVPEQSEIAQELELDEELPESYDSREHHPECPSLTYVRDQSHCGSCWAVSAASTFSDRACIQSKGKIKTIFSDTDLLSCCHLFCGLGCNGGFPYMAWVYFKRKGVCSGGPYNAKGVCKPYAFHPCGHHKDVPYYGECPPQYPTPICKKHCQAGYSKSYKEDKMYAKSVYKVANDTEAIRKEIFKNGPVQAGFTVYEDFRHYKGGVYVHTAGDVLGGHAVKVIGWGVEEGTPYWLIANSWNTDWGEDGYFRILRGSDHCGIESGMVAGMIAM